MSLANNISGRAKVEDAAQRTMICEPPEKAMGEGNRAIVSSVNSMV